VIKLAHVIAAGEVAPGRSATAPRLPLRWEISGSAARFLVLDGTPRWPQRTGRGPAWRPGLTREAGRSCAAATIRGFLGRPACGIAHPAGRAEPGSLASWHRQVPLLLIALAAGARWALVVRWDVSFVAGACAAACHVVCGRRGCGLDTSGWARPGRPEDAADWTPSLLAAAPVVLPAPPAGCRSAV